MPRLDYIDCRLTITGHSQAKFEFEGETYFGKPRLEPEVLGPLLLNNETDARQYGIELFRALFPPADDLTSGYRSALSLARRTNRRLRFRLQIDVNAPPDLLAINWERLYDEKERHTLSRWADTAFSRSTGLGMPMLKPLKGPSKLLVVISNPTDLPVTNLERIDRAKVTEEMKVALQPLSAVVQYEFLEPPATRGKIRQRLLDGFNAVHIQAHGIVPPDRDMAWMMLEKENGEADSIDEDFFRDIFGGLSDLRLVVLMACQSGVPTRNDPFGGLGQTLVQQNFPFVIAMQRPIEFAGAKIFNQYFYSELARHGQIDVAVNEARLQLNLGFPKESQNSSVPVLFMRSEQSSAWELDTNVEVHEAELPVTPEEDEFWKSILDALSIGKLVPIIGPGINHGLLPSNEEITRLWSKQLEYQKYNYPSNNRNDLPRVARFLATKGHIPYLRLHNLYLEELLGREKKENRSNFRGKTVDQVISATAQRYFDVDKNAPHRILADLNISTYLTTNPDNFMAEALKYRNRKPQTQVLRWQDRDRDSEGYQLLNGTSESPIVWHLNGAYPKLDLVLTEDDYLDFLSNVSKDTWRRPAVLMSTLSEALLLFLGFNVRDLDFRVLFKALLSHVQERLGRFAILQFEPEERYRERELELNLVRDFLEKESTAFELKVRWLSLREFLLQLREKANVDKTSND